MLVAAFAGRERIRAPTRTRSRERYRFFSYGDAMLLVARRTGSGPVVDNPLMLTFEVLATEGLARRGRLTLRHGVVETPVFMPVGTYGSVKGVLPSSLEAMGAEIILGNTFHLWLRPGAEVVARFGGLHRFEGWTRPILTDSGGFQVWSLGANAKVSEHGVAFQSPVNGDKLLLTPEVSMQIQRVLDSDIVMQFDECTAYEVEGRVTGEAEARRSMEMSLRWALRSRAEFERLENPNALFGIVQGGMFESLREGRSPASPSSTCPATRSAASASASRRRRCSASSPTRRSACRRTSRAT